MSEEILYALSDISEKIGNIGRPDTGASAKKVFKKTLYGPDSEEVIYTLLEISSPVRYDMTHVAYALFVDYRYRLLSGGETRSHRVFMTAHTQYEAIKEAVEYVEENGLVFATDLKREVEKDNLGPADIYDPW